MATTLDKPMLGEGAYTFPQAARILRGVSPDVSVRQLHYWMDSGLTPASHILDGEPVLTFDDLISLEIVRRMKGQGASLQFVRKVEAELRVLYPSHDRPFAYETFFTDGANVWAEVAGEGGRTLIELRGRRRNHYAWTAAIQTFAHDIHFEGPDKHARRWSLSAWIEIDPSIQFGAPVVAGSRVTLSTIKANLEVGSPSDVADWYGLRVAAVKGARDYLATV